MLERQPAALPDDAIVSPSRPVTDPASGLNDALDGRYAMIREVGRGAAATVWVANDLRHHRQVAIKVLDAELSAVIGVQRFLREIDIIARLSHPHILPLFDSGEVDGTPYFVTPYITGESLRAMLEKQGHLPVDDAVRIIAEVGEALAYAHEHGIMHRDIKPENILVSAGHAVLADFGIARAIDLSVNERLTQGGMSVGTPAYLSPEQAAGDPDVDARADVYSLACVGYETLAGRPPFVGDSARAVIAKRFIERPELVSRLRDGVPVSVVAALMRALEREPEARFQSAAAFVSALTAATTTGDHVSMVLGAPPAGSIAVLPFTNLAADADSEYLADGITEELINALSQVRSLRVSARTSSFAFKRSTEDVRIIGQRLGVASVLEGSIRRAGNRLRITAQLISVADGFHLWSEHFDRDMKDVFEIQDEISNAIVSTVKGKLEETQLVLTQPPTSDLEAYHLYLKGRYFWYRRDLRTAISYFEQAAARDPRYALAYCGVADTYSALGLYGIVPTQLAYEGASANVERALSADPTSADVCYSRGLVEFFFRWNLPEAVAAFREAIRRNPAFGAPRAYLCAAAGMMGDEVTALSAGPRAQEIEPMSPLISASASMGYFFIGQLDLTEAACQQALSIDPNQTTASFLLALTRAEAGRFDEATSLLEAAANRMNRIMSLLMLLGGVLWRAGRHDEARKILHEMYERGAASPDADRPAAKAWLHLQMGELDEGYELLAAGAAQHDPSVLFQLSWRGFAQARADARYSDILRRLSLSDYERIWRARSLSDGVT